jgi:hypothetical protein
MRSRLAGFAVCLAISLQPACDRQGEPSAEPSPSAQQSAAQPETVYVKYRGPVDLTPFNCQWITRSSFINRLCYDSREQYVLVSLQGTYYHYCEVPSAVVDEWLAADSMGRYYNASIKRQYDCRLLRVPTYQR